MSVDAIGSTVSACAGNEPESLAWLQALLRLAMEEVMGAEGDPSRKANSLARLAGLYLKTCHVTELKLAQKQLATRVAELEERLAGLQPEPEELSLVEEPLEAFSAGAAGTYEHRAPSRAPVEQVFTGAPVLVALASSIGSAGSPRGDPA